jgi:hypothetical protein
MKLDKIFYWIGYKVSKHPILVIITSLSIMAIILGGIMFLEFDVKFTFNIIINYLE